MRFTNAVLLSLVVAHQVTDFVKVSAPDDDDVHALTAVQNAHVAAQAAHVANQVAYHTQDMHMHAQKALTHARSALNTAREGSEGLTSAQQESLSNADAELKIATQKMETEQLEQTEWVTKTLQEADASAAASAATGQLESQVHDLEVKIAGQSDAQLKADLELELKKLTTKVETQKVAEASVTGSGETLGKMEDEIAKMDNQVDTMDDIKKLRAQITGKEVATAEEEALHKELNDLEAMIKSLESSGEAVSEADTKSMADQLAHLKKSIAESVQRSETTMKAEDAAVETRTAEAAHTASGEGPPLGGTGNVPTRVVGAAAAAGSAVEIDTEMPYGELEPFGREDTAAELTEASIRESDKMVDQLEKAEVAEEKRSVFRALTRLRGAAITSYDGVARSQTGNIDEYAHTHQWRNTHPLHHLADEESDVSKWAFPDNAD